MAGEKDDNREKISELLKKVKEAVLADIPQNEVMNRIERLTTVDDILLGLYHSGTRDFNYSRTRTKKLADEILNQGLVHETGGKFSISKDGVLYLIGRGFYAVKLCQKVEVEK